MKTQVTEPRYSTDRFAERGDSVYERDVLPHISDDDTGKFVAIDIETGRYEIDRDELAASDRLIAGRPNAQIWLRRIGSRYTHRFGPRSISGPV